MTKLSELTARTRGPNKPTICPTQCTLCGNGTGNGGDLGPCVGCGGSGVPHRADKIGAKPPGKMAAKIPGKLPDLPVRPTDRQGHLVSDAVFCALTELGWVRLAPFDDEAHLQGRML